jgi:hypothetical protein
MLPRLQAEESLLASTRASVGSGFMASDDARRIMSTWERTANPERPRAQKATPEDMARMGIQVVHVPPSATP